MLTLVLPARDVRKTTPRTRLLTVDLGSHAFPFTAGQAVFAGLADSPVRRPYSIASAPSEADQSRALDLLVQIDDHAAPDPHLERATPGTLLSVEGPFGNFGLPLPVAEPRVLFVAGGTGIAPLRSMLQELLVQQSSVKPALLYSARSPDEFAFRDELTALAADGRLDLELTVTREGASAWNGARGRIDAARIRSMLRTPQTRCLVCGPPALVSDAVVLLKDAGIAEERIGWEAF